MITRILDSKLLKENKEDIAFGLAAGLAKISQLIPQEFLRIFLLIVGIIILSELLFYGGGYKS